MVVGVVVGVQGWGGGVKGRVVAGVVGAWCGQVKGTEEWVGNQKGRGGTARGLQEAGGG